MRSALPRQMGIWPCFCVGSVLTTGEKLFIQTVLSFQVSINGRPFIAKIPWHNKTFGRT